MTESEFFAVTDRVLNAIGEALDASDADLDWRVIDGILEIDCEAADGSGGKIIVNRHLPNRELWLATRGGGFHYRYQDSGWTNTRGGADLRSELSRALAAQAGADIELPELDG
ncbi:MAG: iron donor protein CyaY [Casimicrobiaceae bacterium]